MSELMRCYQVRQLEDKIEASVERIPTTDLPEGEVRIEVAYSSLNYKDALAATGNPGVVRSFPHVPGIDAAGIVIDSNSPVCQKGDPVLVTGYELGAGHWGGWAEQISVPAEWVIPLPNGLTLEGSMRIGTAGLTAAMSVESLQNHQITPDCGEVVVTGATGGVGTLACKILAQLGYEVVAVTGKADREEWLLKLGVKTVCGREILEDDSKKPLLKARWAGAIDTVGGNPLCNIIRATDMRGCVTACGMVAGPQIPLSVFPFILRGVTLTGIDSAHYPRENRINLWKKLGDEWLMPNLSHICETVELDEVPSAVESILNGEIVGRVVVRISSSIN